MAILTVKGLEKKFDGLEVLKGIDFEIEKGEVLVIIGSSGSGKSTLLRCLNFLEKPDEGTISLNGKVLYDAKKDKDISEDEKRQKRLHFGLVFQSFNLFPHLNVMQNLVLAPNIFSKSQIKANKTCKSSKEKNALKKRLYQENELIAKKLLDKVGLNDKMESYPCQLSGGQCQRVAIARALAMNPDILCFDEPTSALDPELTTEVLKVIKELKKQDTTMIVVTHEMEFAKDIADKIIYMAQGVIEESGTPEKIFTNPSSERTRAFLGKYIN